MGLLLQYPLRVFVVEFLTCADFSVKDGRKRKARRKKGECCGPDVLVPGQYFDTFNLQNEIGRTAIPWQFAFLDDVLGL